MSDRPPDDALQQILAAGRIPCWRIRGRQCDIHLQPRPAYCNRGNWLATIETFSTGLSIDAHDGWPRYFFELDRAKLELEAWLDKRGQRVEGESWSSYLLS